MTTNDILTSIIIKMVEYAKVGLKGITFKTRDKEVIERLSDYGFDVSSSGDYIAIGWTDNYNVKRLQAEHYHATKVN